MQVRKQRLDIQILRAMAVVAVILYHALATYFPSGYIGIDIFLVVSGYLIIGLIIDDIDGGRFSFIKFYANRIKRLLPAAYTTILLTLLVSPLFLNPNQMTMLNAQVSGAVGFFANHIFSIERNYFSSSSEFGPFLHFWSLSLEEQFYLFMPLLLFLIPKSWRAILLISLSIASAIILYKAYIFLTPTQSYFLLPTRIWQFSLGGLAFLIVRRGWQLPYQLAPILMICIFITIFIAPSSEQPSIIFHPHVIAIIASVLTFALLIAQSASYWSKPILLPIIWIGNISYALYLVHWPIFAFYRNYVARNELTIVEGLVFIVTALIAAVILHYSIERPFHRKQLDKLYKAYLYAFIGAISLIVISYLLTYSVPQSRVLYSQGLHKICNSENVYKPHKLCRTEGDKPPKIFLYGDSFAMHLAQGLAQSPYAVTQATKAGCAPTYNMVAIYKHDNLRTAQDCLIFNESVRDYIQNDRRHDIIILSSPWNRMIDEQVVMKNIDGAIVKERITDNEIIASFQKMAKLSRDTGKKIILVAPPPTAKFNIAKCLEQAKHAILSRYDDCSLTPKLRATSDKKVRQLLQRVSNEADIAVFYFDGYLCKNLGKSNEKCIVTIDDIPLYSDEEHFSAQGSKIIGQHINLADILIDKAH